MKALTPKDIETMKIKDFQGSHKFEPLKGKCPECGHGTIADDFGEAIPCPTCLGR